MSTPNEDEFLLAVLTELTEALKVIGIQMIAITALLDKAQSGEEWQPTASEYESD